MSSSSVNSLIKSAGSALASIAAASATTSRLYLAALRSVFPLLSRFRQEQVLNSLRSVKWPDSSLRSRPVKLGQKAEFSLQPHQGEFDFDAILGGRLVYEPEMFEFLDQRIDRYDCIIEVGANIGVYSLYFEKCAKSGVKIYSFEPSRTAYQRLLHNLKLNEATRVTTFHCAVGEACKLAWFFEPDGHLSNGSLVQDFASIWSQNVKRNPVLMFGASEFDSLLEGSDRSLIKIDTEGYEAHIIRALQPVLARHKPDLIVEVLPTFEQEINQAIEEVATGYQTFAITQDGPIRLDSRVQAMQGSRDCFLTAHPM
ncbi:MAG: FkbM family methyltransferase [Pirellulales bacterium]